MTRSSEGPQSRQRSLELARAAAAGDSAAMTKLLRGLAPEMLRVVRGVLGAMAPDLEDAHQQSMIELVKALPSFRGDCAPAGFACRIAFRTALAVRKRARTARDRHQSESVLERMADSKQPEGLNEARARIDMVRTLLGEIPPEQAEALAMRTMMGWSLEQIASMSGVPLNTVRSRLRLAKAALRKRVEADPTVAERLGVAL